MVEISDIVDEGSLEAWLWALPRDTPDAEARARQIAVTLAFRAAARAFPEPLRAVLNKSGLVHERDFVLLALYRCLSVCSSAAFAPEENIASASAANARSAAIAAADSITAALVTAGPTAGETFFSYAYAAEAAAATAADTVARATVRAVIPYAGSFADVASDAAALIDGEKLDATPLWLDAPPLEGMWLGASKKLQDAPDDWTPVIAWYDHLLDPKGRALPVEMLREIVGIGDEIWDAGPGEALPVINGIWKRYQPTDLSQATLFDFVEFDRRLKMVGFPRDLTPLEDETIKGDFIADTESLRVSLQDWLDYAADEVGASNAPRTLVTCARKLVHELDDLHTHAEASSLRRLVELGSDLSRFAVSATHRDAVGETLAEMLDARLGQYSTISEAYFGSVFAALEPLRALDLGELDSSDLLQAIEAALARVDRAGQDQLAVLDEASKATLHSMLDDLRVWDAEIQDATAPNRKRMLRKRFAEKYGGFSATYGRRIEMGVSFADMGANGVSKFDDAVKWYRRWKVIEDIYEWWDKLGSPPLS